MATQLQRALARPDPILSFTWEVLNVPGGAAFGIDSSWIEEFELPFSNVKSSGIFVGGGYDYFPEFHDTSAFSVTFYGDSEGRSLAYLMNWKQRVKNFDTGLYRLPSEFKADWTAKLLRTNGKEFARFTYHGCWPADTSNVQLNQDGSGRITFQQTFSLDSLSVKVGNKVCDGSVSISG
jgi:hypothetical protein